jgi:hypothetical protein
MHGELLPLTSVALPSITTISRFCHRLPIIRCEHGNDKIKPAEIQGIAFDCSEII